MSETRTPGKIKGYSQSKGPTRGWRGRDEFYALQNRSTLAFEDATRPGESASEIARELRARGRSAGPVSRGEHRGRRQMGLPPRQRYMGEVKPVGGSRAANIRQALDDRSFDAKRKQFNETNSDRQMDERGEIVVVEPVDTSSVRKPSDVVPFMLKNINKVGPTAEKAQMARANIMADNEKTKRETKAARIRYLEENSPAKQRQMAKDAAMDRSVNRNATITDADGKAVGTGTVINSKYGTGSVKMLTPEEQKNRPAATTTDDFGNRGSMRGYLDRKKYVQGTHLKPRTRTRTV